MKLNFFYALLYFFLIVIGVFINKYLSLNPEYTNNLFVLVISALIASKVSGVTKGMTKDKYILSVVAGVLYSTVSCVILELKSLASMELFEYVIAFGFASFSIILLSWFKLI